MIRIAAETIDVTPDRSMELGGSWSRRGPLLSTGVDERLEANLMLLEGPELRLLLVSIDALFAGPDLADDLTRLCARNGHSARVIAFATHTHWAPMLDPSKPRLGRVDPCWYGEVLLRIAHGAERASHKSVSSGRLSTASRDVDGSVGRRRHIPRPVLHRRRLKWSGTIMGPNLGAARAPTCHCAIIRGSDGAIVCALVCWACHPADRPVSDRVSPDFVGTLRRAVRKAVGEVPVLFLQGFSGDVRARIPMARTPKTFMRWLIRGPVFMSPSLQEWESWAGFVGDQIAVIAKEAADSEGQSISFLSLGEAGVELSNLIGGQSNGACRAFSLGIGDGLELVMFTAEVSAEYAPKVERLGAWPVGCVDDVFGYFPTDAQLPLGGYEVSEFREAFGVVGRFRGNNDAIFEKLLHLARSRRMNAGINTEHQDRVPV